MAAVRKGAAPCDGDRSPCRHRCVSHPTMRAPRAPSHDHVTIWSPSAYDTGVALPDAYAMFAKLTYNHTDVYPKGMMGNFSRTRLPETVLREMYDFLSKDLGLRVPVTAVLSPPSPAVGGSQYTLTVKNTGSPGGLAAQGMTIALRSPSQTKIVATTGAGYAGVVQDPELKATAATWRVKKLTAGETLTYTLTLSEAVPDAFKGSFVRWMKPEIRRPANLALNPTTGGLGVIPDKGDGVTVVVQAPRSTN